MTTQPLSLPFSWRDLWPFRRRTETQAIIPAPAALPAASTSTPAELLRIAVSQGADLEKLTKLMDLQERWEKEEARKAFAAAISAFKENPPEIVKNATASFTTKKGDLVEWDYASLDHICEAVISGLSQHGISHDWDFEQPDANTIRVTCVLTHKLGHSRRRTLAGPPDFSGDKTPIHAIYSTVSHLERYTLLGAIGLAAAEPGESNPQPSEMSPEDRTRENLLRGIQKAATEDQLRDAFVAAFRSTSDKKAQAAFISAKDARRKVLRGGRQ